MNTFAKKFLIITAHPDDLEMSCGGLVARVKANGGSVTNLVLVKPSAEQNSNRDKESVQQELEKSKSLLVLPEKLSTLDSTKHLYNQLDFQKFLPVQGEYEWCRDQSGLEFPIKNDQHPSTDQHLLFVEKVILPFLDRAQISKN